MARDEKTLLRKFHEAKWDEQIIFEMSVPGERGILVREPEAAVKKEVGDGVTVIPQKLRRKARIRSRPTTGWRPLSFSPDGLRGKTRNSS